MQAVVEFSTFHLEPRELDQSLEVEHQVWTKFLSQKDGFLRRKIWQTPYEPSQVHSVIWWSIFEQLKQITRE